jgi:hypothetical protein
MGSEPGLAVRVALYNPQSVRLENDQVFFSDDDNRSLELYEVLNLRLCAGICKHVRFCWIFVGRLAGPPSPPYLVHPRSRQCFQAFCNTFHVRSCCDFFLRQFLKGWLRGLARYKTTSPKPRACLSEGIAEVCRSSG